MVWLGLCELGIVEVRFSFHLEVRQGFDVYDATDFANGQFLYIYTVEEDCMQVILQENFPSLGFIGDVVNVKNGYARNFLFPKQIAMPASDANVKYLEHRKKLLEVKKAENKKLAAQLKDKIEGVLVEIQHSAGEGEKLFGSVTVGEIHEQIASKGFDVDRKLIRMEAPIRTIGEHLVEIKLHQDVSAQLKIVVTRKPEPKVEKAPKAEKPKKAKRTDGSADVAEEAKSEEA